jgi:hypothetical protein
VDVDSKEWFDFVISVGLATNFNLDSKSLMLLCCPTRELISERVNCWNCILCGVQMIVYFADGEAGPAAVGVVWVAVVLASVVVVATVPLSGRV